LENGILILSGPAIKGSMLTDAAIEDVAPTVYHLLGLPVPRMVDGNVLSQALTDASRRSLTHADIDITETGSSPDALSDSDAGKIAESLKNLGYLD
jgi:arylsulfatase A-like enzyme